MAKKITKNVDASRGPHAASTEERVVRSGYNLGLKTNMNELCQQIVSHHLEDEQGAGQAVWWACSFPGTKRAAVKPVHTLPKPGSASDVHKPLTKPVHGLGGCILGVARLWSENGRYVPSPAASAGPRVLQSLGAGALDCERARGGLGCAATPPLRPAQRHRSPRRARHGRRASNSSRGLSGVEQVCDARLPALSGFPMRPEPALRRNDVHGLAALCLPGVPALWPACHRQRRP